MVRIIAGQVFRNIMKSRTTHVVLMLWYVLVVFAAVTGWSNYHTQNEIQHQYQQHARESWEGNPDKHPHRMAHFGTFAFRLKHPLSIFDGGIESYVGNVVFLEAHKTNTVNFSEASLSTSLIRFGEISMAMLLQIICPLIVFFIGYAVITKDRENGTIRLLMVQGGSWAKLLIGKWLGLLFVTALFIAPVLVLAGILTRTADHFSLTSDDGIRYLLLVLAYALYACVVVFIAVAVSAYSPNGNASLLTLLGIWLFFSIIFPKAAQAMGAMYYPTPSKIEFEAAIEDEVLKKGDYHNPDDIHFATLRDSLLQLYQVDSIQHLPFNYSGFIMREGERITAAIYNERTAWLLDLYEKQNNVMAWSSMINPFAAIKRLSMALCGTDFHTFRSFQRYAEDYRYKLAQHMNTLQMELISNRKPTSSTPHKISSKHWTAFPDFKYRFITLGESVRNHQIAFTALVSCCILTLILFVYCTRKENIL